MNSRPCLINSKVYCPSRMRHDTIEKSAIKFHIHSQYLSQSHANTLAQPDNTKLVLAPWFSKNNKNLGKFECCLLFILICLWNQYLCEYIMPQNVAMPRGVLKFWWTALLKGVLAISEVLHIHKITLKSNIKIFSWNIILSQMCSPPLATLCTWEGRKGRGACSGWTPPRCRRAAERA